MAIDQAHRQNVSSLFLPVIESVNPCLILVVRRENIVGDAMEVLRKTKNIDYKKPLKVSEQFCIDIGTCVCLCMYLKVSVFFLNYRLTLFYPYVLPSCMFAVCGLRAAEVRREG